MVTKPASPFARCISRVPQWTRHALVSTLAGCALGAATAIVLVVAGAAFPSFKEIGEDYGLWVAAYFSSIQHASGNAPVRLGDSDLSFVLVDVDPAVPLVTAAGSGEPTSVQPCTALEQMHPGSFDWPRAGATVATAARLATLCSPARPVSRYLLAALVRQLRAWQARVIVLDVLIAAEPGIVDAAENAALVHALSQPQATPNPGAGAGAPPAPIVWAAPLRTAGAQARDPSQVLLDDRGALTPEPALGLYAAVAQSPPGEPIRRYAKCFWDARLGRGVASLPYLAAQLAVPASQAAGADCTAPPAATAANSPRIVFTLPGLESHQDDVDNSRARRKWAYYSPVYNRCLAAAVWSRAGMACADPATFRGKVVIIGGTNALRRDRHQTPLGDMAGAEVVINAMRSFVAFPRNQDKPFGAALVKKLYIVGCCSLIWLAYYLIKERLSLASRSGVLASTGRALRSALLFAIALAAACTLAFRISFSPASPTPSLDIMLPVLAIALDVYVEQARALLDFLHRHLEHFFGIDPPHGARHD